jgi:hypothetical protein
MIPFGGGCVMVWGGISLTATTGFYVVNRRSLNSGKHITDILEPHVSHLPLILVMISV